MLNQDAMTTAATEIDRRTELLRSLHVPGDPLLLPNAWDVATAEAVASAGFPVVATTSGGIAAALGYADHEGAPGGEMLAAAARICGAVEVPVTVDAEAGYGIDPADLVATLRAMGAAGCNLEDADHAAGRLRDPSRHAEWLGAVRNAAAAADYDLVINARIDVFLADAIAGRSEGRQGESLPEALHRAELYLAAGADCVFPIALWEAEPLARFVAEAGGAVNALAIPPAPTIAELGDLGVARVSWGTILHRQAIERFAESLASL
jgi:2-methylisocitrate lyase-like PEP mutase family enzyme